MKVDYEIHEIKNASGTGQERRFVRIHHNQMLTEAELETTIEHSCSATRADVRSVLAAVAQVAQEQLARGNRFYLPGIGRFAVGAKLSKQAQLADHKVTGKDIYPSGIQFQPEETFYKKVTQGMSFNQSPFSTKSKEYEEEAIWQLIAGYLEDHEFISKSELESISGLSRYMANKWLRHFSEETGALREEVWHRQRIYYLNDMGQVR